MQMKRPDHADFWLMAEVVQDLDYASEDVGLERTLAVDAESVTYMALQRGVRVPEGRPRLETFAVAWIDGFAAGMNFQKRKAERDAQ